MRTTFPHYADYFSTPCGLLFHTMRTTLPHHADYFSTPCGLLFHTMQTPFPHHADSGRIPPIEKKNQGTNENHLGAIFRNFSNIYVFDINFAWRWNLKNFEILRQDDFHLFLDFSFLDQNPLPKKSFYFWNSWYIINFPESDSCY